MNLLLTNNPARILSLIFLLSAHSYIFGQEAVSAHQPSRFSFTGQPAKDALRKTAPVIFPVITAPEEHQVSKMPFLEPLPETSFFDHVRFGGSLGASFSNGSFSGYLAPKAVYDFNRYFSAGTGLMGSYRDATNYTAWTFGGSLIGLARPFPVLQLSAEIEEHYVSRNFEFDGGNIDDNYWTPALFFGLGYTTGPVTVGVRYDVLHDDEKSIYADAFMPFVSIFF